MTLRQQLESAMRRYPGAIADRHRQARQLPDKLDRDGLLVGWSMEGEHQRQPMGFSFGDPDRTPQTGYIDPVLMEGEGHLITIAPTGAGKGVGCIIPALLRHQGPVIVIDPKGENAMVTARRRQELGQQVVVIDPMQVTGLESACLNPLDLITADSASGVDDAVALVQALLPDDFGGEKNLYWVSRGRQALLAAILHVATDYEPEQRNLAQVRKLINEMAVNPEKGAKALASSRHPEARAIADNLKISAPETLGGILSFAQEGIDFLRGPLVERSTRESTFELAAVTSARPLSIYVVLPPHMLESHARLLRLWISTLLTLIMRRRSRPAEPTLFILDEAAQLGSLAQLRQALTLLRGYGLQTWSFWQDVSQLQLLYQRDWQTMVNNCRVIQAFGANNLTAASSMASLMGFVTGAGLLDLMQDEMLLQIAGDDAVIARRPNYLTDPIFEGLYDDNPLFDTDRDPLPQAQTLREYLRPEQQAVEPTQLPMKPGHKDARAQDTTALGPTAANDLDTALSQWILDSLEESSAPTG
jgi:type IV secretion system protein VirD4